MRKTFYAALLAALCSCQCNPMGATCTTAAQCGAGQVCLPIGHCAPTCGSGCEAGEKCSMAGGCIPSATCGTDGDCSGGKLCSASGSCMAACSGNSCGSGQMCTADGHCVAATGGGGGGGGGSGGTGGGSNVPCPPGLMCNVACSGSTSTTVSGKVYDPAMKNPLYNAAVYVPANPLQPLPKGVPTGASACSCGALYASGTVVSTTTAEDGTFTLTNVPVGTSVPLVIQIGKWRRAFHIAVTQCQDNPQPDKSLAFPGTVAAGNTDDNIPDIAVSTGNADTLECLMRRIGLPTSEYVAGAAGTGHVHVFSGGDSNASMGVGKPENPSMSGAPASSTDLWDTSDHLMPYDIVLLSCEGGETYNANPPALETYLNAGGRAFGSHFHYSWFAGPLDSNQMYSAPADWGSHLATWTSGGGSSNGPIGGVIETTLNGSANAFPKGVSIQKWLGNVGALGKNGVPAGDLSIYQPRYNADVTTSNTVSQPWIISSGGGGMHTMYFSFDTPVTAPPQPDGGAPAYCGRAVFSDLHVGGDPATNDNPPPPMGCDDVDLSPQEKALEFMLFDLSSCVVSDSAPPIQIQIN